MQKYELLVSTCLNGAFVASSFVGWIHDGIVHSLAFPDVCLAVIFGVSIRWLHLHSMVAVCRLNCTSSCLTMIYLILKRKSSNFAICCSNGLLFRSMDPARAFMLVYSENMYLCPPPLQTNFAVTVDAYL